MLRRLAFLAALGLGLVASGTTGVAQQVKAEDGVAILGNVFGSTIIAGVPPDQLEALVKGRVAERTELQTKLITQLEARLDLNNRQIRAAVNILGEANVPPELLAAKLVEIAERFKALQEAASAQPGDNARTTGLKADAQKAIDAGELGKADALLETVESEQRHAVDRLAVNAAVTSSRRGDIAMTRLRYREAATHYADAAAVLPPVAANEGKRFRYLQREAFAVYLQGYEFADGNALSSAIQLCRRLVELEPRERRPLKWASAQNCLGNALLALGVREGSVARLEAAIAAYHQALRERTRERKPLEWAQTTASLGLALWRLSEREPHTGRLDEAVSADREALKEYTRERSPLAWAMIQNNLGLALMRLAELRSGTAQLEEAVSAFHEALTERTRERVPLDWARTQNNLGLVLESLGARKGDSAELEEAVAAFRHALTESTRERVPLEWANAQSNLGSALARLGERASGTARLEEAVAAYHQALTERTRERVPLQWAATQDNLGSALARLGERESGTAQLEEAVAAHHEALTERTRERAPFDWAVSTAGQGVALIHLAQRTQNAATAKAAVEQIEAARDTMQAQGNAGLVAHYQALLEGARSSAQQVLGH
jgi:tetratricopeptide (TPR) repeat protein